MFTDIIKTKKTKNMNFNTLSIVSKIAVMYGQNIVYITFKQKMHSNSLH